MNDTKNTHTGYSHVYEPPKGTPPYYPPQQYPPYPPQQQQYQYHPPQPHYPPQQYPAYEPYEPYQYTPAWPQSPFPQQRQRVHTGQKPVAPPPVQREHKPYEWKLSDYEAFESPDNKKRRKRNGGFVIFSVCLLLMASIGIAGVSAINILNARNDIPAAQALAPAAPDLPAAEQREGSSAVQLNLSSRPPAANDDAQTAPDGRLSIPDVAELVKPSVVSVVKYAGHFIEPVGIGSGIILSENGYIVTNEHVVRGGTDFKIYTYNGDPYDARIIGADAATDLAILKIDAQGLTPANFGDSNELRVGETVVAIGNPVNLDFAGSVTMGIISALNRQVEHTRYSIDYIQTDAAINPGNSGGALANEFGQVIGINVAKIAATGYEGMCFAIPSSAAMPIIEDLLRYGRVTGRVKIGITGRVIDEIDARRFEWPLGVMIESIDEDSDLIGKNVQKQDIITHVNGERVFTVSDIHQKLEGRAVGDTITLTLFRRVNFRSPLEFDVDVVLVEDKS
jgi:serine protease Do